MSNSIKFLQGNEACVEGALYAGVEFFAGYPITPSTEIAEVLSARLPEKGGKFIQMEDEIASMCAIVGASLTGRKVMTATSGPGFSLKQEAIGYACMAEIPCVIANVQRGGPSTGNPTHVSQGDINQARWGTHGDHNIIALTASNHQDVFSITVDAFNLAETYRTPVILLLDEAVGHLREKLVIPEVGELPIVDRLRTSVRKGVDYHPYLPREDGRLPMSDFGGDHRYNVTGLFHDMWGFPSNNPKVVNELLRHLVDKIDNNIQAITRYKEHFLEDADYILVSYGSSARSAIHLAKNRRAKGEKIGGPGAPVDLAFSSRAGPGKVCRSQSSAGGGNEYGPGHGSGEGCGRQTRAGLSCQPHRRSTGDTFRYQKSPSGYPGKRSVKWL